MAFAVCGRYIFENVGKKRIMTITKASLADDAAYECVAGEERSFTEVFVRGVGRPCLQYFVAGQKCGLFKGNGGGGTLVRLGARRIAEDMSWKGVFGAAVYLG